MKKKAYVCIALTAVLSLSTAMFAACGDPSEPESSGPVYSDDYIDALYSRGSLTDEGKAITKAHDPIVVEAKNNGKSEFYAFSTDNDGGYGVQVRKSENLYNWEFVGPAIKGYTAGMSESDVISMYANSSTAELKTVYSLVRSYSDWSSKGPCYTLWAPDVVPAAGNTSLDVNGGWWLYSCWTAGFGSPQSVIFKLSSQNVAGPYEFDGIIVQNNTASINEIDPSIYYTPDGDMYMSYGSYSGGFATIKLDPETGLRAEGESTEAFGKWILNGGRFNAEGSVISYHSVPVYTGDIANEEYDADKWETQSKYYMMGSWGALAYNYNMRVWTSDTPDGTFTSERGVSGLQVSGTWTWRKEGEGGSDGLTEAADKDLNFYIPGHNDMLTTTDGVNVIAYHTRVSESGASYNSGEHFLYTSMYDFNSKGQLVINPNRYVGEKIGTVTAEDVLKDTDGLYSAIVIESHDNSYYEEKSPVSHPVDLQLNADGTLTMGDETGAWKVYGDHYIWIQIGELNYYGSIMPAQIRQYDSDWGFSYNNGLTISAICDDNTTGTGGENKILYMNMQF